MWRCTGSQQNLAQKVVLVDLNPPRDEPWSAPLQRELQNGRAVYIRWDVRQTIPGGLLPKPDLIFNLAAVHREPGHLPHEYFETNLYGAENVCFWASSVECQRMVFTSSIAPYGPSEELKDEESLPVPDSPYGSSKLAAEKMHIGWQAACRSPQAAHPAPRRRFWPRRGRKCYTAHPQRRQRILRLHGKPADTQSRWLREGTVPRGTIRSMPSGRERRELNAVEFLHGSASHPGELCCRNSEGGRHSTDSAESAPPVVAGDFVPDSRGCIAVWNSAASQPRAGAKIVSLDLDRPPEVKGSRLSAGIHSGRSSPGLEARSPGGFFTLNVAGVFNQATP